MTYFSDFEHVDYLDDYNARQNILQDIENVYLKDTIETVPNDLLDEFDFCNIN
jgi:hypothetical protein